MKIKSVLHQRRVLIALSTALVVAIVASACAAYIVPAPARQVDLALASHVALGMAEQDVYVASEANADQVMRITPDQTEALADAPLFLAAAPVAHDPFAVGEQPFGPFSKGAELGMTLNEWLAATGTGTYTVRGDEAELDLSLVNLAPNGVYTLWCSLAALPTAYIVDLPCGALDGSENVFTADENGRANFQLTMDKLPDASDEMMVIIALAYHSDGQTHGMYPGSFGMNSHVHIFTAIPTPDDEAWRTVE